MRAGDYRVWVCVEPSVGMTTHFPAAANRASLALDASGTGECFQSSAQSGAAARPSNSKGKGKADYPLSAILLRVHFGRGPMLMAASNGDGGGRWWVIGQRWAVGMHASSKVWPGTQALNALEPRACRQSSLGAGQLAGHLSTSPSRSPHRPHYHYYRTCRSQPHWEAVGPLVTGTDGK